MNDIEIKQFLIPESLETALQMALLTQGEFKYLAGGTDVMVNRFQGNENSECLIDISTLDELKGIRKENDYIRIGSLEVLEGLIRNPLIMETFPILCEAASSVGAPLIRKSATIGGNILCENRCLFYNQSEWWRESIGYCLKCDGDICIATGGKNACFSEFISDTAPALIVLNAEIEWTDHSGLHRGNLETIYTGDGVNPRNLSKEAIVTSIHIPARDEFKTFFKKLRERESLEFTSLTVAISVMNGSKLKIALSGVDPMPVIYNGDVNDNKDDIIKYLKKKARSVDNDMYSRSYRKEMIPVFLNEGFEKLGIS